MFEAENDKLKSLGKEQKYFHLECIEHDDNLVCLYLYLMQSSLHFLIFLDLLLTSFITGVHEKVIVFAITIASWNQKTSTCEITFKSQVGRLDLDYLLPDILPLG